MKPLLAVPLPDHGHLSPMLAVLERLVQRGERVVVATLSDREQLVREAGFEFVPLMERELPVGWLDEVDALRAGAASVAQACGLPAVALDGALTGLRMPGIPEPFLPWSAQKESGWFAQVLYTLLGRGTDRAMRPVLRSLNRWREARGLAALASVFSECDALTRLCQHPRGFEPGVPPGDRRVHYLGLFRAGGRRPAVEFPWERLDGRPLVYASVGTIAAPGSRLFARIAGACAELDLQLVIGLGGKGRQVDELDLAGDPIVAPWAPQVELLERAALCITHAGLNTTLEALWQGVPLVAVPLAFDQPGVAWRIQRSGAGRVVPSEAAGVERFAAVIGEVLRDPSYAQRARALGQEMRAAGGADAAAGIIATELAP